MSGPTPGWNDPPPLSYDPKLLSQPAGRRNLLNKRVGHSLSTPGCLVGPPSDMGVFSPPPAYSPFVPSPSITPIQAAVATLDLGTPLSLRTPRNGEMGITPPPPAGLGPSSTLTSMQAALGVSPPPSVITEPTVDAELVRSGGDSDEQRRLVLALLNECLNKYKITLQKRVVEDVQKRLSLLESMWIEGKFSSDIQSKLLTLSKALNVGDHEQAYNLHQTLIVDHPSIVISWMVGVKHLILQVKNSHESLEELKPIDTAKSAEKLPEEAEVAEILETSEHVEDHTESTS